MGDQLVTPETVAQQLTELLSTLTLLLAEIRDNRKIHDSLERRVDLLENYIMRKP